MRRKRMPDRKKTFKEKMKGILFSECGLWIYIVLASVAYGAYCHFAGVPNPVRRQEPVSAHEIIALLVLALPVLLVFIVKGSKRG
ncbi:hypothetical protein LJC56_06955 [Christensenellaceae bacterium OttesenSCG-928-K19]|nr:hypothetical protein [Christensenellaceae bacterium OttesenSCG-928-K19]